MTRWLTPPNPTRQAALLFVYGTMLSHRRNYSRLARTGALLIGEYQTVDRFVMGIRYDCYQSCATPMCRRDPDGHPVEGELYAVPWLSVIDDIDPLEGHPEVYRRELVQLRGFTGCEVLMYVYQREFGTLCDTLCTNDGVLRFRL